jgi:SAM-dependent methyltransferase
MSFPTTTSELQASPVFNDQWYYSAELLPDVVANGAYPPDLAMLPRLMMRNVDPSGMECLDIGTMEGLIPALLDRRGASRVLAVDAISHAADRMAAIKHYHDVDFEFREVGQSFDFVNLSGVLYHVLSPILTLAAVRPLLRRNGILEVSTNVVYSDRCFMEWNDAGRLQSEANTFWYPSIPLFDYMLRLLKLAPIDCMHVDHTQIDLPQAHVDGLHTGYVSILCRAVDDVVPTAGDEWMRHAALASWEHRGIPNWTRAATNPLSEIQHVGSRAGLVQRPGMDAIDVWASVQNLPSATAASPMDTHLLRLADTM